jgi:hypothetical protein
MTSPDTLAKRLLASALGAAFAAAAPAMIFIATAQADVAPCADGHHCTVGPDIALNPQPLPPGLKTVDSF